MASGGTDDMLSFPIGVIMGHRIGGVGQGAINQSIRSTGRARQEWGLRDTRRCGFQGCQTGRFRVTALGSSRSSISCCRLLFPNHKFVHPGGFWL
ncbi:uncharacterized protein PGTG_00757 [Puccinia graminis f. sp. tritici CRL 75-36-700-3]|uniref:Uncharacterized protein n=1 Tax=Puccinia graminis f. sp. tritici (strain CRL 75-36-700-3 / race SCCL) TaxID=418459 RepID=E3JTU4_PUCGT|nr:uncharacterized protein PGTG_00757 [Puccinia graminis f. sp. tritici CRL 75-36-700-3]EFP75426.1 hypothetical protein PGTG_00757 [Puccinia graminis f. sp. tritici CRL 75-36-700-3]